MCFISILLCLCCVLCIASCMDYEPSFFAFVITHENFKAKCLATKENCTMTEGKKIEVPIIATNHINFAIIERGRNQKRTEENSITPFKYDMRDSTNVMIVKSDRVNRTFEGKWRIKVYMLPGVDPPIQNVVEIKGQNYTEVICTMNVHVKGADGFVCNSCVFISIGISIFMCIIVIAEGCLIFYYRNKAKQKRKYAQLSTVLEKSNDNGGNARYCEKPGQKPAIASDRHSSRESGIYEALEALPISRRPPIPEPPELDTLPRPPKPIPTTILREPLPNLPPVHSSLLRQPANSSPVFAVEGKNKPPVATAAEDDNTYEPPPVYRGPPPNTPPESDTIKNTPKSVKIGKIKLNLTKKPKVQQESKEKLKSSVERIKERPPMPIPAVVQDTQVFEGMTSSSTASLVRNAEPKISSAPIVSLAPNDAPNKPMIAPKKLILPKPPEEPKQSMTTRFTNPKPDTSKKPTKLNQPDNAAIELSNILKKRKDISPSPLKQDTNVNMAKSWSRSNSTITNQSDNAEDELSSALKKRKEKTESGSMTPATEYPRKKANAKTEVSPVPMRHNAGPMPESSGPTGVSTLGKGPPSVQPKPIVEIHVEGADYDEHAQSSDDDWTYEPLENYNIYSL